MKDFFSVSDFFSPGISLQEFSPSESVFRKWYSFLKSTFPPPPPPPLKSQMVGHQWWPIYSGVRASCLPCPPCFIIEWCGIRLRGPKNWNSLKGLRDDFRYYFHTLKTRWNQRNPWNNGSVLFVDNNYCYYISTVSFCLWLSMAKTEGDCNAKKTGPSFSSYAPVLQKNDRKQITLCFVFDIFSLRVLSMSTDAWLRTP